MSQQPNPILQSTIPGAAIGDWGNTNPGAPSQPIVTVNYAQGLSLSDGSVVSADLVALLTGNASDDILGLSAGTGVPLPVETRVAIVLGSITGTVQLDLQGGNGYFLGASLAANVAFTVANARLGSVYAVEIVAFNSHAATPPPGTTWVAGTPPPGSAGPDLWVFTVDAVTNGVPTLQRGSYTQGYA